MSKVVREWVAGWAVSRGTPAPVEEPWGLRVDVGLPNHVARHVLVDTDEAAVRTAARSVTLPGTRIKAFLPTETVAAWLCADWAAGPPAFLMTTRLRTSDVPVPHGYTLTTETRADGVTRARALGADGSPTAHGQIAAVRRVAVVDRVATEPAHQRRGLASLVMSALTVRADECGATTGVLAATAEGRALYESLGWTVHAPLAGFRYAPRSRPARVP